MSFRISVLSSGALLALATSVSGCAFDADTTGAEALGEVTQGLTYQVGPGAAYANLQAIAASLKPGDVVQVAGDAVYSGGIRLTNSGTASSKIRIVGVRVNGKRPVLSGGVNTIELAANYIVFEGFEVTAGTSRCVYHHGHEITIRDSVIHDCPAHGILGADSGSARAQRSLSLGLGRSSAPNLHGDGRDGVSRCRIPHAALLRSRW
jgi:hypothetical protein